MKKKQELLILKGIPASGKSTFAKKWIEEDSGNRVIVSRDAIRESLIPNHHLVWYTLPNRKQLEKLVTVIENTTINNALFLGFSVVVDATNLGDISRFKEILIVLNHQKGYNIDYSEKVFEITLEEVINRDIARRIAGGRYVGAEIITKMYNKFK